MGFLDVLQRHARRRWLSLGSGQECNICGWGGHSFDVRSRPNKPAPSHICPKCRSSERHRLAYYVLKDSLPGTAATTLHFAPEHCVSPWLRAISGDYLSADLVSPLAMRHVDITELPFSDDCFSLIWCSHVLEHIEDDAAAMRELYRVLKPGGLAVILVPIYGATTYEDASICDPAARLKHFKQVDHVRLYGLDIAERIHSTGLDVELVSLAGLPRDVIERCRLSYPSTNEIFLARKPASHIQAG